MEVQTKRIMTLKSMIKFGEFPHLTVGDFIRLLKYKELIGMYYRLDKIDFNDEVKNILGITKDLEIPKPGRNHKLYYENIYNMICEINKKENKDGFELLKKNNLNKKIKKEHLLSRQKREDIKILNKNINQKFIN